MSWNSSNWNASYWDRSYWWLGGSVASGGGSDAFVIISTAQKATGLTLDPDTRIITYPGLTIASGSVYDPSTRIIFLPGTAGASALTYNPSSRNIIFPTTSLVSGLVYLPQVKIIVIPSASLASGSTNAPTLSIGSTIFVGAALASARTRRPLFGDLGTLPEDFAGTTEIITSEPTLRKGILKNNNNTTAIVLAGQSGLSAGDTLVYLGNGQWRKL